MLKQILLIVIILLFSTNSWAEEVKNPVVVAKIRGDGMLIDENGLIIGIRNNKEPRANDYEFYYYGVSPEGDVTDYSVYKVYQDPSSTVSARYMQETIIYEPEDNSAILAKSAAAQNTIIVEKGKVYFNGREVKSGDVLNGGVMVFVKAKLYYNGTRIESGTAVLDGKIVSSTQAVVK